MQHKSKILVVGWATHATGMGRVLEHISTSLTDQYEVHYFGLDNNVPGEGKPWFQYAKTLENDRYGVKQLSGLLNSIRPAILLIHFDSWIYEWYRETLLSYPDMKVILYCLSDGEISGAAPMASLQHLDYIVSYTRYGQSQLQQAFAQLGVPRVPSMSIIGHGVDHCTFFPLLEETGFGPQALKNRRNYARQLLFGAESGLEDDFIVLNAAALRPRKEIAVSIRGFELFAQGKPSNVKLYLHADILNGSPFSAATAEAISRLRQENRLLLTSELLPGRGALSDADLNLLYNACDVGINTAAAEGWGLISCEHGATGAAQIIPEHTNLQEIWTGAAVLMQPVRKSTIEYYNINLFHVDETAVAAALETLYTSPEQRSRYAIAAYQRTRQIEFQWDYLGKQWTNLIEQLIEIPCELTLA